MKKGYTHIHMLLDRTGSMSTIRDDTIGGFNTFLEAQRNAPGEATVTLIQFDSVDPHEVVYDFKTVADAPVLTRETYIPRASTPLLDAIGRSVNDLADSISGMKKKSRPQNVVFVIITDGEENSSHEYTKPQIKRLIEKYGEEGWQFVFLGANLNAIQDAVLLGVPMANTMAYDHDRHGTQEAFSSLSANTAAYRSSGSSNALGFTDEDREKQKMEKDRAIT